MKICLLSFSTSLGCCGKSMPFECPSSFGGAHLESNTLIRIVNIVHVSIDEVGFWEGPHEALREEERELAQSIYPNSEDRCWFPSLSSTSSVWFVHKTCLFLWCFLIFDVHLESTFDFSSTFPLMRLAFGKVPRSF